MKKYLILLTYGFCSVLYAGIGEDINEHFAEANDDMLVFCCDGFVTHVELTEYASVLLKKFFPDYSASLGVDKVIFCSLEDKSEEHQPLARLIKKYAEKKEPGKIQKRVITGSKYLDSKIDWGAHTVDGAHVYYIESIPKEQYFGQYFKIKGSDEFGNLYLSRKDTEYEFWNSMRKFCHDKEMPDKQKMELLRGIFPSPKSAEYLPSERSIYSRFSELYSPQSQADSE